MELQLTKHKPFTDLFEVLKDLIPDTILHCSKEGFKIRASDYSSMLLCNLSVKNVLTFSKEHLSLFWTFEATLFQSSIAMVITKWVSLFQSCGRL